MNSIKNFVSFAGDSIYKAQQRVLSTIVKLKEVRGDADSYQKVCQIAYASFQLTMIYNPAAASLGKLSNVVSAVSMHDFYRFVQYPRSWFFPVTARTINEEKVQSDILDFLREYSSNQRFLMHDDVDTRVKDALKDQLELMDANDDAYENVGAFLSQIQEKLKNKGIECNLSDLINLEKLNLEKFYCDTSLWFRRSPILERIMNVTWNAVDMMTVAFFLKEWKLIDTAKYAEKLGQIRGFHWIKNQSLEVCLIGGVCAGFTWKLLESVRKLLDQASTQQEIRNARWNIVTSVAELAYFGSVFTNLIGKTKINNVYIQLFALGAKSLGLLNILKRPRHEFFPVSERTA